MQNKIKISALNIDKKKSQIIYSNIMQNNGADRTRTCAHIVEQISQMIRICRVNHSATAP